MEERSNQKETDDSDITDEMLAISMTEDDQRQILKELENLQGVGSTASIDDSAAVSVGRKKVDRC